MRLSETNKQDYIPFEYTIVEARGKPKQKGVLMTLEGVLQRADTKNANGRVYPRGLWDKIMADEDVNTRVSNRRMLGELDHPASGSTSLSRVSHVITEHGINSNGEVRGKIDVLDTPSGQIAATLFEAGVQLGISSRGDGSVEKRGEVDEVQEDFRLETYDLVLKPSTPGAYPQVVESEEAAQKNTELIAQAVEGLVKSTTEIDVLLECHKIISVLPGCELRCENALALLKQKLSESQKEPKQLSEVNRMTIQPTVSAPSDAAASLSPEMAKLIQGLVDAGVAEAVAGKDIEISKLNQQIVELSTVRSTLETRLGAAEELIEEFTRKVKDLSENQQQDEELVKRHNAAVALLDESVSRLQEMGEIKRRLVAAESLLAASLAKHQAEAVERAVDRCLEAISDETVRANVSNLLEDCKTSQEVEQKFAMLSSIIETKRPDPSVREPLPPRQGEIVESVAVTEVANRKASANGGDFVTAKLLSRVQSSEVI